MKRIAMWSGPRNISTAMMRSFENRADTTVVDEPFYASFLKQSNIDHPLRELVLKSQPSSEQAVINMLTRGEPEGARIFYQKQMCHHMLDGMDTDWMSEVTNAFLIRDPRAMVASYVRARKSVELFDLGTSQMIDFFKRESDRLGKAPIVVESSDILKNPEGVLKKLCSALDIPFDADMLKWPAGKRVSDGVWAPHWYASVEKSTGFKPYVERDIVLNADHEHVADKCLPAYEMLSKHRI